MYLARLRALGHQNRAGRRGCLWGQGHAASHEGARQPADAHGVEGASGDARGDTQSPGAISHLCKVGLSPGAPTPSPALAHGCPPHPHRSSVAGSGALPDAGRKGRCLSKGHLPDPLGSVARQSCPCQFNESTDMLRALPVCVWGGQGVESHWPCRGSQPGSGLLVGDSSVPSGIAGSTWQGWAQGTATGPDRSVGGSCRLNDTLLPPAWKGLVPSTCLHNRTRSPSCRPLWAERQTDRDPGAARPLTGRRSKPQGSKAMEGVEPP